MIFQRLIHGAGGGFSRTNSYFSWFILLPADYHVPQRDSRETVGPGIRPSSSENRFVQPEAVSITNVSANLHKINPPPKFNAGNLSLWKREHFFRNDIYQAVPEDQLVCSIGIHGDTDLKEPLIDLRIRLENGRRSARFRILLKKLKGDMVVFKRYSD